MAMFMTMALVTRHPQVDPQVVQHRPRVVAQGECMDDRIDAVPPPPVVEEAQRMKRGEVAMHERTEDIQLVLTGR